MFSIVSHTPAAPLATGQSVTLSYPADTSAATFASSGHKAYARGLMWELEGDDGDFTVAFGASNITFTHFSATSIPAGSLLRIEIQHKPEVDLLYAAPGAGAVSRTVSERLAETVSVKDYGAVGDGVADDSDAVQKFLDFISGGSAKGIATGTFRVTRHMVVKSGTHVEGVGSAVFLKDYLSASNNANAMFINENYGVMAADGDASDIMFRNVTLKSIGGTNDGALMSMNNINGLLLENVSTYKEAFGFSVHISGQNILVKGRRLQSVDTFDTNMDGLHFNWVKNLVIDSISLDTEDDCIAFTADPAAWTGSGPAGKAAENIVISNVVGRAKLGGFRIGNGIISGGETGANDASPALVFKNVRISNCIFEGWGATGAMLALEDRRSNATDQHDDIVFDNCKFKCLTSARLVNVLGNDDPSDPAKTWKNYGTIEFHNCQFEIAGGLALAGAHASGGGAFDTLRLHGCRVIRTAEDPNNLFNLRNFGTIELRGMRVADKTSVRGFFLREYDAILMSDVEYVNDHSTGAALTCLACDAPNAGALVVMEGVVARGDVNYRIQGALGAVTVPNLYITSGAADTVSGDAAPNVAFTKGQIINPALNLSNATTPTNFSAARRVAIRIDGATYYVPADTAAW